MPKANQMASPLRWPAGRPRTKRRQSSKFEIQSIGKARDEILRELRLFGARYVVISTDLRIRKDGLPYSDQRQPDDKGVAVYFDHRPDKKSEWVTLCITCDRWDDIRDNLHAIALTVAAWRGIERWGASETFKRTINAFRALPAAGADWRAVLDLPVSATLDDVKRAQREKARAHHPDQKGGNPHEMIRINQAVEAAKSELKA